jgi:hypothetical protein
LYSNRIVYSTREGIIKGNFLITSSFGVERCNLDGQNFAIHLVSHDEDMFLAANSEEERDEWIQAFNGVVADILKLATTDLAEESSRKSVLLSRHPLLRGVLQKRAKGKKNKLGNMLNRPWIGKLLQTVHVIKF